MLENAMFWHDDSSNQSDTNAMMNNRGQMREMYSEHYLNEVQSNSPASYTFRIK